MQNPSKAMSREIYINFKSQICAKMGNLYKLYSLFCQFTSTRKMLFKLFFRFKGEDDVTQAIILRTQSLSWFT